jgi:hypothetical protein
MYAERPPVREHDIETALETPDTDQDGRATRRIGSRTIIVYYTELKENIHVRSVSATRRRLAP